MSEWTATYDVELNRYTDADVTIWYQTTVEAPLECDDDVLHEMAVEKALEAEPNVPPSELELAFVERTAVESDEHRFEFTERVSYHVGEQDRLGLMFGVTEQDGEVRFLVLVDEVNGEHQEGDTVDEVPFDAICEIVEDDDE
ncbi:hypothetical protein HUG10_21255 (plasmid) [Halorarum halophilum]|uniref:Uncharacterized protein n=1 Tax=Halorarum halophilum TaxID=2743090 RepID=A0A7D5KGV3_9EURY|nr:hypothetical protein [Halobaculum halophilum]QLG30117.1 hypothetical protein HUG10_21255 [Halobaculum halophilum]